MIKQPILLTGIHRSGTTWVGRMISEAEEIHYIDEAFTPSKKHINNPINKWYIDVEFLSNNKKGLIKNYLLKQAFSRNYSFLNHFINFKKYNLKQYIYKTPENLTNQFSYNKRPLFKDPIALFSTEWFYKTFNSKVIIIIRHPAAFISSALSKEWGFPVDEFKLQKNLIDTYLNIYKEELNFIDSRSNLLLQNILAWNLIYTRVKQYIEKYPQWFYVKHENLITNPINEFEKIFNYLDIEFTEKLKNKLIKKTKMSYSGSPNTDESKLDPKSWEKKLDKNTIKQIKSKTAPLWYDFYKDCDW